MPTSDIPSLPAGITTIADLRARWELLTYRQQQIALLIIEEDLTYNQIAERLVLSLHTVKHHINFIFSRLGVRSRRDLRYLMIFTRELHELLKNHPGSSRAKEESPPPPA